MPRKKSKSVSKKFTPAPKKKVNKSAWIREQSREMSAKAVVEKAAAAGIKLTVAQVYTARSSAKTSGKAAAPGKRGPGRPKKSAATGGNDEMAFRRLVLSIGLPKAEAYLADLKRSVGL